MTLKTQAEIEAMMYEGGITRAENIFNRAEEKGAGARTPAGVSIINDYVLPLAEALRRAVGEFKPGYHNKHLQLLAPLNMDSVAYLAVRCVLNNVLTPRKEHNHRTLAAEVGRVIHSELVLTHIEAELPELYYTLSRELGRRLSKSERHRMTVFKMQAKKNGIEIPKWDIGSRDQVGLYILGLLETAGMIEMPKAEAAYKGRSTDGRRPKKYRDVFLADSLLERVEQIKAHMAITVPVYGPCVEPPKDWVTPTDGGFHTNELRRTHRNLVRASGATRDLYRDADMPKVLRFVNALQRTRWQVNTRVLDIVLETGKVGNTGEIVTHTNHPPPPKPACADKPKEERTTAEEKSFVLWKREMAEWYTQRKLNATKFTRFYSATRTADMFRDYPEIFFTYFLDSRGRAYPMTTGLSPQGSDLQRGLLRFAEGRPVRDPDAIMFFKITGANLWGFDKATMAEMVEWVDERSDILYAMGTDPLGNTDWHKADNPIQFLAWCLEYAEFLTDPVQFRSHIKVGMDGSCNGLQHLSALLRDEVGGTAVNLRALPERQDIYQRVADKTKDRVLADEPEEEEEAVLRAKWIKHGFQRGLVKRPVMTTPYGVTLASARKYIVDDYLREGMAPIFSSSEYRPAAKYLIRHAWPAIGDVVVKGRECMSFLRRSATVIANTFEEGSDGVISWTTPSGFPATQAYFKLAICRVYTHLHGLHYIRVASESDDPDPRKHSNGLAPNFVHSLDAAHLCLTVNAALDEGIVDFAVVHDDYGCHADKAAILFRVLREQFVKMYEENDPLQDLKDKYPMIPKVPEKGTLDIREVLESDFFFL